MRMMIAGATTTVEEALADRDIVPYLGAMLTSNTGNRVDRITSWGVPWCADAGCFPVEAFDPGRYMAMVVRLAEAAVPPVFVVVPDVVRMTEHGPVGDHESTLRQFEVWHPRVAPFDLPLAFVAQDIAAVFIGGSDQFKDDATADIAAACHERGKWCHLGRVNGRTRLRLALLSDVDSVDGSSLSRFPRAWLRKFAADIKALEQEACHLDRCIAEAERDIAAWDALLAR